MSSNITTIRRQLTHVVSETGPVATLLVLCTWWLLLWRMLPVPVNDQGFFVTVAERLLAGDRLYANVYENKDLLFHYSNALARLPGPFGSWALSVAVVVVGCLAVTSVARQLDAGIRLTALLAWVCTPVIITGHGYFAGTSEMPGLALMLVLAATSLRKVRVGTGIALGLLVGFKLVMLPVALVFLLTLVVFRRTWAWLAQVLAISVATYGVVVALAAMRGEWLPYLSTLLENVYYSKAAKGTSTVLALETHLQAVFTPQNLTKLTVTTALLVIALAGASRLASPFSTRQILAASTLAALVAAVVVIAFTGIWEHHALILAPMAVLSLVIVVTDPALPGLQQRTFRGLAALLVLAWLVAGIPAPTSYVHFLEYARGNLSLQQFEPVEARLIKATGPPSTYARIGTGEDGGAGYGLRDWDLACRRFGQAYWDSPAALDETLQCLPSAKVVLVDGDAMFQDEYPDYNRFLTQVFTLLAESYTCHEEEGSTLCVRVSD